MNKYRVFGHTSVNVIIEVVAENEAAAYKKAAKELNSLEAYVGNGGYDKLIGVYGDDRSVETDESIDYDDIEDLGPAPDEDDEEDE